MASLMALFDKLSLTTSKKYDSVTLYQKQYHAIFVNLCEDDKTVIGPGIEQKNYYTRDSFLKTFGIDFEEILANYFYRYDNLYNLNMNYDDILMTVIYLMKYMITNRDGEDEITFIDYCKTLYSQHIKETKHNPFIKLVVGDGYVGDNCINHVYISFNNFFVSQKERQFMIFFRY